jgi:ABC-type branched-subunit amino acid transport system permease subunit
VGAWLVALVVDRWFDTTMLPGEAAQVVAGIVAGVLAFLAAALMLRIEEVDVVRKQLLARWRA